MPFCIAIKWNFWEAYLYSLDFLTINELSLSSEGILDWRAKNIPTLSFINFLWCSPHIEDCFSILCTLISSPGLLPKLKIIYKIVNQNIMPISFLCNFTKMYLVKLIQYINQK